MDKASIKRVEFVEALKRLLEAIGAFRSQFETDTDLPARDVWGSPGQGPAARRHLLDRATRITYEDDQHPRRVLLAPGILMCSEKTLERAAELNQAKDHFQRTRSEFVREADRRKAQQTISQSIIAIEQELSEIDDQRRHPEVARALGRARKPRLHLVQADRHLPVLDAEVTRISWSWSVRSRRIQRMTVAEALEQLEEMEGESVERDRKRLTDLPPEMPLARVYSRAASLRANLYRPGHRPRPVMASLPLLVPAHPTRPHEWIPEHNIPPEQPPESHRLPRSDQKIEPEPICPSIRLHRYTDI